MLKGRQIVLGFLLATAIWSVIFVLQSDTSAYYQICETNQYTDQERCTPHHFLYVAVWYVGYVINPTSLTALATIAIAWFTWTLKQSTDKLWSTGNDQIVLARNEFNASHRPRMRLKHAWFVDRLSWQAGGPLEINFDFVNVGNADAVVTWVNYQSLLIPRGQRLPQRPPYDEYLPGQGNDRISRFRTQIVLPSGITLPRTVCDGILDEGDVDDIQLGTRDLYLIGTIEYWHQAGHRQTAFCRRLTYESYPPQRLVDFGRFEKVCDPDYEYED